VTGPPQPDPVRRWAADLARSTAHEAPCDVLAGVALAVGTVWSGPGEPTPVEVPAVPGWVALDAAREALLDRDHRRRLGAHHTPPGLARRLVDVALEGLGPEVVVADPACGGGAFLVAAADALVGAGADPERVLSRQLAGLDLDPLAVATSEAALVCWGAAHGTTTRPQVRAGDGLLEPYVADVVVGNPPFLSPLGVTTGGGDGAVALRRALAAPYADTAGLFLVQALASVPPGGRVVLLQPESLLTARDARPIREAASPHLDGMWVAGEPVFRAAVRVCAPVLVRDRPAGPVRRWSGRSVRRRSATPAPPAGSWAALRPSTAPKVRVRHDSVLGDIAGATAGFRDEFYGVAAGVTEGADDADSAPIVTSGLVDPGRILWGERSARIAGRRYARPVVDVGCLDERLQEWVVARLVPKVLVATQTRVVEAAADPVGRFLPLTPVVSVTPADPADLWRVAAALTSPVVSAWALRTFGGAALSADAIKLAARQVLVAPLPADAGAWDEAAAAVAAGDVVACARALAGQDRHLFDWWAARMPSARTV
jgi:hypothetical protein